MKFFFDNIKILKLFGNKKAENNVIVAKSFFPIHYVEK